MTEEDLTELRIFHYKLKLKRDSIFIFFNASAMQSFHGYSIKKIRLFALIYLMSLIFSSIIIEFTIRLTQIYPIFFYNFKQTIFKQTILNNRFKTNLNKTDAFGYRAITLERAIANDIKRKNDKTKNK